MPPKSSTRRFDKLAQDSGDLSPNPLIEFRLSKHLHQRDLAAEMGVNKSVVTCAEEGMFQLIPAAYRNRIADIKSVNRQYQDHRRDKRIFHFNPEDFPSSPHRTAPVEHLLDHYDLSRYQFGAKACVHDVDLWKMSSDATQCTQNFLEFLNHIRLTDVYPNWIDEFNAALRRDHPPKLRLT